MSEHRRKPSQSREGGRAASRRADRQRPGRGAGAGGPGANPGAGPAGGGRAEARRAAARRGNGGRGRSRGADSGRMIDYPRAGRDGWRRFVPSWRLVCGTVLGFLTALILGTGIGVAVVGYPDANKTSEAQNNVFFWADGSQMVATGGTVNRQIVGIERIPKSMRNAVIAAENVTFETDKGIDPTGIARAVVNMAKGGSTQGGSTITQQYVKNTFLTADQTLKRKVTELLISIKLGLTGDKNTILAGYLNTAYYGRDAYGIQAAARAYFGKDCQDLNPSESAFLAAMLKGPNLYNPDGGIGDNATPEQNTIRAKKRWAWVLDREVLVGRLEQSERDRYRTFPALVDSAQARSLSGQIGYLVDTAKSYVLKTADLQAEELAKGGFQIHTTFDKAKVEALSTAVQESREAFLDEEKRPAHDTHVQVGAASVDVESGAIVALYGGPGFDKKYFNNNANTAGVPVGSTWKPFVLAAAFRYGTQHSDGEPLSPASKYNGNDLAVIDNREGQPLLDSKGRPFRQKNESDKPYGYVTLTEAMEKSINTPFAQLVFDVGHDKVRELAESTGILKDSMNPNNDASFALGTSTPSAIRMADSYATFAASGSHHDPFSVTKVLKDGKELPGFEAPEAERAMDNTVADNVTDVLRKVVTEGTGTKAAKLGRPAAGKTGTTDQNKSAWFVGYTPELSTAVALFRNNPNSPARELMSMNGTGGIDSIHGGDIPAVIWTRYMKAALDGRPVRQFPPAEPLGVVADAAGAPTPEPSAPASASPSPSESAPSPSASPSGSASPGAAPTCKPWDLYCDPGQEPAEGTGGAPGTPGGGPAGEGGPTPGPMPTEPGSRPGRGGLLGGESDRR
ncbi:transglycosylase domain-containing protein [Streptomyces sp. BI20]|uniref:transglycosylase domain-containing protein n=1 Tax=Streptomyces sp. BI20 TaxID=3403460 RepID=UPI003C731E8B